ncbi:fibronectin type III domain-containing protein [Occallatibacter riparius]|uniref:Fibronectin type III domain-containing protein n=1 Tax=Occallatibacter riparius TaxID=1002689 RepID=A0A9J7BXU8_9BACT|nr:fibronectin type III domain-containing protein [Occallatibacter riparius]UWZ85918.1 fibronectin type III domain-containing protein [Occallatibacter riparius]
MSIARQGAAAALLAAVICVTGCGTPGAPQPPSLNLPERVTDLSATRTGNQITLTWTMPKRTTDRVLLKGDIAADVCWNEGASHCVPAGEVSFVPSAEASFTGPLPGTLATGAPRPVSYFVELKNRKGKSAGLSNAGVILAGQAPAPVTGLAAEVRKQGVVLRWSAADSKESIRLKRTLLNPPEAKPKEGPLTPAAEPVTLDLLVEPDGGGAMDKEIRFGRSYEYRAQRIARITAEGKQIELDGELSAPVRIAAEDIFPPVVPAGLAAVATGATGGSPASIDLSWQPDAEADVAGYRVYRREGQSEWKRISGDQLVVGPAFHDAEVQAGHTYSYAVTAVDARGNESGRSDEASDAVPQQ